MSYKKQYSETTDEEKRVIREYQSWCKSDCEWAYKYHKAMEFMKRATDLNITHLL